VYSRIIDEVCDASQIDFEEGGVDAETLKLLKQVSSLSSQLLSLKNIIQRWNWVASTFEGILLLFAFVFKAKYADKDIALAVCFVCSHFLAGRKGL
jgi:hypothetical protein